MRAFRNFESDTPPLPIGTNVDVANGVTTERHGAFLVVGWACELARSMLCLPMLRLLIKREGAKDFKMEIAVEIKL